MMIRTFSVRLAQQIGSKRAPLGIASVRFQSTDYSAKCEGLIVEPRDKVLRINFNRPQKYNAISRDMCLHLTDTFKKVNGDKSIEAIVISGNGDYYSSGNDLTNFLTAMRDEAGPVVGLTKLRDALFNFVESLINLEKLTIVAINGPAVGISVSTLPLYDYIIASDKATFQTPFTALGQCPEACSSYTFPRIMGRSKASELLLLNMSWDAKKAQENGLISDVIPHEKFHEYVEGMVGMITKKCYPDSTLKSKSLIMNDAIKQELMGINKRECDTILKLWLGDECANAIQKFFKNSKK